MTQFKTPNISPKWLREYDIEKLFLFWEVCKNKEYEKSRFIIDEWIDTYGHIHSLFYDYSEYITETTYTKRGHKDFIILSSGTFTDESLFTLINFPFTEFDSLLSKGLILHNFSDILMKLIHQNKMDLIDYFYKNIICNSNFNEDEKN